MAPSHLPERGLIKISGAEAELFLQNLVTQNVAGLQPGKLVYGCLLTPQGRFLHDLFIFKDGDAFYLDCETARRDDLLRRLTIFKLRAKVVIEDASSSYAVYAGDEGQGPWNFDDPRLPALGKRFYLPVSTKINADASDAYKARRIHLGVPEGSIDIRPDIDMIAEVNLDFLRGVDWNKGCFVGQEVTARVEHRGLMKRRLVIASGAGLEAGEAILQDGRPVGEIRSANAAGTEGLALLRIDAVEAPLTRANEKPLRIRIPDWLVIKTAA